MCEHAYSQVAKKSRCGEEGQSTREKEVAVRRESGRNTMQMRVSRSEIVTRRKADGSSGAREKAQSGQVRTNGMGVGEEV